MTERMKSVRIWLSGPGVLEGAVLVKPASPGGGGEGRHSVPSLPGS